MKVGLLSPMPGFHKELFDIVDIFIPQVDRRDGSLEGADLRVIISQSEENSVRRCQAELSGALNITSRNETTITGNALLVRRLHKRQLKTVLFDALTKATGKQPPWGSLTGIRPARLVLDAMGEGLPLDEAASLIQNTFQITDAKISLLNDIIRVQQGLPQLSDKQIACYIGIPFCSSRCRYCSFISTVAGKGSLLTDYVQALKQEIAGTIALMKDKGLTARSVYLGGGTPTVLDEDLLAQVLEAARPLFQQADEVTVEAGRPDSITKEKLQLIHAAGVHRISINPQTMHDKTLELVGRRHSVQQTLDAYQLAREVGINNINMDLIAGLPGESLAMFDHTLNEVLKLEPEAVTVHTLSVKRSSDMHRFGDALPEGRVAEDMVVLAREAVSAQGMQPYYIYRQKHMTGNLENVGYALPGKACLYNIDMMEDKATVMAMGAGAISKYIHSGGKHILRAPNVKDAAHYMERVDEMLDRKKALFEGKGRGVKPQQDLDEELQDLD